MDDRIVEEFAFANYPYQICQLTQQPTDDPVVFHRDLSDWFPDDIKDIRDERLVNLMIVDRKARDAYYNKLKQLSVVVSLSGGIDSTTVLFWAKKLFGKVYAVIFDYGQRHKIEIEKALNIAKAYSDIYVVAGMKDLKQFSNSSLTRSDIDVPVHDDLTSKEIPNTFVPGRNLYFCTAVSQFAYRENVRHIAFGFNLFDYSGYPDCRPEFVKAMREAIQIGIFNGMAIGFHAPLMFMKKVEIIRLGLELGVPYEMTHSCYNGIDGGCGECDSCKFRRAAFHELGLEDPAIKEK